MADSEDRISELPKSIKHHILSLLRNPKDIVRTRILSKEWREVHNSFNIIEFDQRNFKKGSINQHDGFAAGNQMDPFSHCVTRVLQSHHQRNSVIQKIELNMTSYDLYWVQKMPRWLNIASNSKIRELHLCLPSSRHVHNDLFLYLVQHTLHNLYRKVFTISTLTSLRLFSCNLGPFSEIKLPILQKLCLGDINVTENAVQNLIRCCPLIEDLRFICCSGLKKLQVSGLTKLKNLELHRCHLLKTIQVDAPNLQTFWHYSKKYAIQGLPSSYNLDACTSLRSLTLKDDAIGDKSFQKLLLNFPQLETLELSQCDHLVSVEIIKLCLKRLVLRKCKFLRIACIDTPNLSSFEFEGNLRIDVPFLSLNPGVLKEAKFKLKLTLGYVDKASLWYPRLCEYLLRFDHSAGLILVIYTKKYVIVHEDLREILIPLAYDFTIEVVGSSKRLEDVLEYCFQALHPKTLCVVSSVNGGALLQLISRIILKRDRNPNCCERRTLRNKCWRHFLRYVGTRRVKKNSWFKSSPSVLKKTRSFRLAWKPKSDEGMA